MLDWYQIGVSDDIEIAHPRALLASLAGISTTNASTETEVSEYKEHDQRSNTEFIARPSLMQGLERLKAEENVWHVY